MMAQTDDHCSITTITSSPAEGESIEVSPESSRKQENIASNQCSPPNPLTPPSTATGSDDSSEVTYSDSDSSSDIESIIEAIVRRDRTVEVSTQTNGLPAIEGHSGSCTCDHSWYKEVLASMAGNIKTVMHQVVQTQQLLLEVTPSLGGSSVQTCICLQASDTLPDPKSPKSEQLLPIPPVLTPMTSVSTQPSVHVLSPQLQSNESQTVQPEVHPQMPQPSQPAHQKRRRLPSLPPTMSTPVQPVEVPTYSPSPLSHEQLKMVKLISTSRRNFALQLARIRFTPHVRLISNFTGRNGRNKFDTAIVEEIKANVFKYWPLQENENPAQQWRCCKLAIINGK